MKLLLLLGHRGRLTVSFHLCLSGAMQTPEAGADSTSTVPLQTTVPVQPAGSTQQVPVQQQVPTASFCVCLCVCLYMHVNFFVCDFSQLNYECCIELKPSQFVFLGPDCSTGSACLPSTGAVCGGEQRRLHQWQHVSQSVYQPCSDASSPTLAPHLPSLSLSS